MDSYLIRIYRRDKENPEAIIGIIEEIGSGKKQSFGNLSELTTIISKGKGTQASPLATPGRQRNRKKGMSCVASGEAGKKAAGKMLNEKIRQNKC